MVKSLRNGKRKKISFEDIQKHFGKTSKLAAKSLGISITQLKRKCREFDIPRWPGRRIKSLRAKITKLSHKMRTSSKDEAREIQVKVNVLHNRVQAIRNNPALVVESSAYNDEFDFLMSKHCKTMVFTNQNFEGQMETKRRKNDGNDIERVKRVHVKSRSNSMHMNQSRNFGGRKNRSNNQRSNSIFRGQQFQRGRSNSDLPKPYKMNGPISLNMQNSRQRSLFTQRLFSKNNPEYSNGNGTLDGRLSAPNSLDGHRMKNFKLTRHVKSQSNDIPKSIDPSKLKMFRAPRFCQQRKTLPTSLPQSKLSRFQVFQRKWPNKPPPPPEYDDDDDDYVDSEDESDDEYDDEDIQFMDDNESDDEESDGELDIIMDDVKPKRKAPKQLPHSMGPIMSKNNFLTQVQKKKNKQFMMNDSFNERRPMSTMESKVMNFEMRDEYLDEHDEDGVNVVRIKSEYDDDGIDFKMGSDDLMGDLNVSFDLLDGNDNFLNDESDLNDMSSFSPLRVRKPQTMPLKHSKSNSKENIGNPKTNTLAMYPKRSGFDSDELHFDLNLSLDNDITCNDDLILDDESDLNLFGDDMLPTNMIW